MRVLPFLLLFLWGCASVSPPPGPGKPSESSNVLMEALQFEEVKADKLKAQLEMEKASLMPLPRARSPVFRLFSRNPWVPASFRLAYQKMMQGRKGEASRLFISFASTYPNHPLADDALYLAATLQEAEGLNAKALSTLRMLVARYPGGDRYSQAMLKMGLILVREGKVREGVEGLKEAMGGPPFVLGREEGEALLRGGR